ncbi:MAG: hypothetical protein ACYTF3_13710 [Planctomycetota bacterium]|jgi:hypothetical protein
MKRQVLADDEVAAAVDAGFVAVIVDSEDPDAGPSFGRFGVRATPTTIVADADGEVLARGDGRMSKEDFLAMLASVPGGS